MSSAFQISPGQPEQLEDLYAIAADALRFDLFSPELLEEKLFRNPRPTAQLSPADATRFGAGEDYDLLVAAAGAQVLGFLQLVTRPWQRRGWIGLFAVAAGQRRRGVARALLDEAVARCAAAGAQTIDLLGIPGNYFAPGLDPRYTAALCLLEKSGFERFGDCANLVADLTRTFDTARETGRLAAARVEVRRATRADDRLLDAFFAEHFGQEWRFECELAQRNSPSALHLALRDGRLLAFSAHSSQNREWGFFGPMGTDPAERQAGCGRVLLWHCLNDLREQGHTSAVIPWVGPIGFYARHAVCRVERVFWRLRKTLAEL